MLRYLSAVLFICFCLPTYGQSLSGPETAKNYSISQKRLLVTSTFQFANFINQDNLDKDSVMLIACHITGMPFLLPYNEGFSEKISVADNPINGGRIRDALTLLNNLEGERKIQLLIELGIWFLHQPGVHKMDLDSAGIYIENAYTLSRAGKFSNWKTECDFLFGELLRQRGNIQESKKIFNQMIDSAMQRKNIAVVVRAWQQLGTMFSFNDSTKWACIKNAIDFCRKQQGTEKEIELLLIAANYHSKSDPQLMETDLRQSLSLMHSAKFSHTLYVENELAYAMLTSSNYVDGLAFSSAAFENCRWSGINAVEGAFLTRIGNAYWSLGKLEEAFIWFKKALDVRTDESHLFWYKSLFFTHSLLIVMNKPLKSLALIDTITLEFPAVTLWEKMQILSCKGECYERLNNNAQADKMYTLLFQTARHNPFSDPFGELWGNYIQIARFYILQNNLEKATLFLNQALLVERNDLSLQWSKYDLLYRIDSLKGNYKSALENHIKYKLYYDSTTNMDQRRKLDELTIKYAAEKKDQDIKLLKQEGIVQQAALKQNKLTRNLMIAGSAMLLTFLGLLYNRFLLKQKSNRRLESQQNEIAKKNASLQELVEQKEWLLKEVHHRVKNNLQIIISLLNTQSNYLESEAAIKAIRESQDRMNAISLIHQKLYKSEDTAFINIGEYVHELVEQIRRGFSNASGIVFELNIADVQMDVAQAVPLGLILNEAISNAVKYAFPGETSGVVTISIIYSLAHDNYTLTVADNGVGLPPDYAPDKKASFGIRLMKGLTKQLGGSFAIGSNNGVKIAIAFAGSKIIKLIGKNKTNETVAEELPGVKSEYATILAS